MEITFKDKIDIESIKDDNAYQVVAHIVDNRKVLKEILRIRKSLGLKNPVSYRKARNWPPTIPLGTNISLLKEKYKIDDSFNKVLKFAILAGKVTNAEYKSTAHCVILPLDDPNDVRIAQESEPRIAILISPETKPKEVNDLMLTKVKELYDDPRITRRNSPRKRNKFRNARRWYWMSKKMKFSEICDVLDEENKSGQEVAEQGTIESAVKRYRDEVVNVQ